MTMHIDLADILEPGWRTVPDDPIRARVAEGVVDIRGQVFYARDGSPVGRVILTLPACLRPRERINDSYLRVEYGDLATATFVSSGYEIDIDGRVICRKEAVE